MTEQGGFLVLTEKDWEGMTPTQQSWATFNTMQSMCSRLTKLEKRPLIDKVLSFSGGLVGGVMAAFGIKWGA